MERIEQRYTAVGGYLLPNLPQGSTLLRGEKRKDPQAILGYWVLRISYCFEIINRLTNIITHYYSSSSSSP
jgi:hypothetical protein